VLNLQVWDQRSMCNEGSNRRYCLWKGKRIEECAPARTRIAEDEDCYGESANFRASFASRQLTS